MTDDTPGKKRSWLKAISQRVQRLYDAVDDRCVQWRYGSFEKQQAALIARLKEIQGGDAALKAVELGNAKISVVSRRRIDGVKGRFSRPENGQPTLRVSSCGDLPRMTATLWHELRHLRQHMDRGDLAGGTSRLHDTRAQHMVSLMIEADAFTSQALMCLQQKKAGNPEYLDSFIRSAAPASRCVRAFLKRNPYEGFQSDAHFARALFADLMRNGLPGYHRKYLDGYHRAFEKAKTADSFRALLAETTTPPDFAPSPELARMYGRPAETMTSVRALALAFYEVQPREVRETLGLINDTVSAAATLTDPQFRAARKEILSRTGSLKAQFAKVSGPRMPAALQAKPLPPNWRMKA